MSSTDELASKLKRTEIQHVGSSIPGREIVQVLTEIPAGVESGWHMHPGEEVGYILAGTVEMRIEGERRLEFINAVGEARLFFLVHSLALHSEAQAKVQFGAVRVSPGDTSFQFWIIARGNFKTRRN